MQTRRSALIVLLALALTAGLAHAEAPFSLDLVEPAFGGGACGEFDLYQQPLGSFNTARTSDADSGGFEVAEAYLSGNVPAAIPSAVDGLRVWGIDIDFSSGGAALCATTDNAPTFTVSFYADNAGDPGAQVAQVTGVPATRTETGIPFAFTTIQQYDLEFPAEVDPNGGAWVGVVRETGNDANCFFLWVDEDDPTLYDNRAWQFNAVPEELPTDQTLCLGAPAPNPLEVPTLGTVGVVLLSLFLAGGALLMIRRRA